MKINKCSNIFKKSIAKKDIYKQIILVGSADEDIVWWETKEGLEFDIDSPILMGSIRKLYI